jgi:lipoyl(octanoyl) transferase
MSSECRASPFRLSSSKARKFARSFIIAAEQLPWRLLLSPPLGGPENMALDEALMARARRTGEHVLRVYGWSSPTLSLGRNQRARGIYLADELERRGIGVVRRPTGGRALLHHREITYSVTAPCAADAGLVAEYQRINLLLGSALGVLGVRVTVASPASRSAPPSATPCFAEPARGELVLDGRKLVGSAQWRHDGALLQHGSILVDDDQACIPSLMREPAALSARPATLRDALGRAPVLHEVAEALFAAVHAHLDPHAKAFERDDALTHDTERLATRFRDETWTWRR